jgi:hypothetical protein
VFFFKKKKIMVSLPALRKKDEGLLVFSGKKKAVP